MKSPKFQNLYAKNIIMNISKSEPDFAYYVLRILETTDKDLLSFEGKVFIQKVDE